MKKLPYLLVTIVLLFLLSTSAGATETSILVNGSTLPTDVQPVIQDGRVYIPVRALAEALGADVSWDDKTQTVNVTKNGITLAIDLNRNTVLLDGKNMDLGDPLMTEGGRTLILAQALKDAFGVDTEVDSATGNVSITYREQVAGMAPEDLLLKSLQVMSKYNTYKFRGSFNLDSKINNIPFTSKMIVEGSCKKPDESYYYKITMPMPENKLLSVEGYVKDGKMYQNVSGAGWKELSLNLPADFLKQIDSNDPAMSLKMIREIGGIISAGSPEKVDGSTYNVIRITIDPVKMKDYLKNMTSKISAGDKDPDLQKAMQGILSMMDMNIYYNLYIDSSSNLVKKMDLTEVIKMNMPGAAGVTTVKGEFNMYGFGQPVEMPAVPAAK